MENRKILTINVDRVLSQAQEVASKIVAKLPYKIEPRWPIE